MSAIILNGKELAAHLEAAQAQRVSTLKAQGIAPKLAVVKVGDDPASAVYVRNKTRVCERLGILSDTIALPADITQAALLHAIDRLNADDAVHGVLIQLPLPAHLDENAALMRVRPDKDVDGFHLLNAGALLRGQQTMLPCTPKGIIRLLKSAGVPLDGKHAVVVGRSNIVGKPAALMLLGENCTVTVCHSHTENLAQITRQADILVVAIGRAHFITADMVKPGAAVIDVGINRVQGKVTGDVDYDSVAPLAGWITPVPGGIGPMTVSMLMENTLEAAWKALR